MPQTELELKIFLICLFMTALAYASGWVISLWYNNYEDRRGKHRYRISRKKSRLQVDRREEDSQTE